MKLILSTHNVTLTKAIEDHLLDKIDKLDHLDRWVIDARVTLEQDHPGVITQKFGWSIRLGVRGPDLFAEARENDLYGARENEKKNQISKTCRDAGVGGRGSMSFESAFRCHRSGHGADGRHRPRHRLLA